MFSIQPLIAVCPFDVPLNAMLEEMGGPLSWQFRIVTQHRSRRQQWQFHHIHLRGDAQTVLERADLSCCISYRVRKLNAEEKDLVNCFPEAELVKFRLKVCIFMRTYEQLR